MNNLAKHHITPYLLLFYLFINLQSLVIASERVALVIGNGSYKNSPLKNPANDADSMALALKKLGFNVIKGKNIDRKTIRLKIRQFGDLLKKAKVGLFYYAGHGVQYSGDNYLIPINADINEEFEIIDEAISASSVLLSMENAKNPINIVILDACRNNPFSRSFRSGTRGLTKMDGPKGSLIAYATAPGKVAADGSSNNGLYTEHLLKYMNSPGLKIEEVFKKVRIAVSKETKGIQIPWENSSLMGDFYFAGKVSTNKIENNAALNNATLNYEKDIWNEVKLNPTREMYQAYLADYPDGYYSRVAKIKLMQDPLNRQEQIMRSPNLAKLTIQSNIKETKIEINGQEINNKPITLKAGEYTLKVSKKGYQNYLRKLKLTAGSIRVIYARLKNLPPTQIQQHDSLISTMLSRPIRIISSEPIIKEKISAIELLRIPSGCFMMGSRSPLRNEQPIHSVCISQNFYLGKYEVTQGQWQAIMGNNPAHFYSKGSCTDSDCPIESISWDEVQLFIKKLNKLTGQLTGQGYRLPTEAEWEYACQANSKTAHVCSRNIKDSHGWTIANSNHSTHRVGLKQANAFGLFDMLGNVKEWVNDWYDFHYYHNSPKQDPQGPISGFARSIRGSGWSDNRSLRMANKSDKNYNYLGFRLAKSL